MDRTQKELNFKIAAIVFLATLILLLFWGVEQMLYTYFVTDQHVLKTHPLGPQAQHASFKMNQAEYNESIKYNRWGFREKDFQPRKTKRIVFLGDSFVEGMGVSVKNRFTSSISSKTDFTNWEIINLGQAGTSPIDYYRNILLYGPPLEADIFVVNVFIGNDFMSFTQSQPLDNFKPPSPLNLTEAEPLLLVNLIGHLVNRGKALYPKYRGAPYWDAIFKSPINKEFFMRLLKIDESTLSRLERKTDQRILNLFYKGKINPSYLSEYLNSQIYPPSEEEKYYSVKNIEYVLRILKMTRDWLTEANKKFLVVIIPSIFEIYPEEYFNFLQQIGYTKVPQRLRESRFLREGFIDGLKKLSIKHLDLYQPLKGYQDMTYHLMDGHFNSTGHQVAADEISDSLRQFLQDTKNH